MHRRARLLVSLLAALPLLAAVTVASPPKPAPKASAYAKTALVLKAKCVGCHNGPAGAGGVNLANYAAVTKGKFQGKALVVPKKPKDSVIVKAIHGTGVQKMPPPPGKLTPVEMKTIESWIAAGAKP